MVGSRASVSWPGGAETAARKGSSLCLPGTSELLDSMLCWEMRAILEHSAGTVSHVCREWAEVCHLATLLACGATPAMVALWAAL